MGFCSRKNVGDLVWDRWVYIEALLKRNIGFLRK